MVASVAEDAAKLPASAQAELAETLARNGKLVARDVAEVRAVRKEEAEAQLPDSLFDESHDDYTLGGEQLGEPIEAILARELQSIIERLPDHPSVQGVIRDSIIYAAERLADIAAGTILDEDIPEVEEGWEDQDQDPYPYPDDVEQGRIEREEIDERAGRWKPRLSVVTADGLDDSEALATSYRS
jgi:hypothetical protein